MNDEAKPIGRIVVIPFLHGKITADGKLSEPDIYFILEKWLERHPQFRGREQEFRIVRSKMLLPRGVQTDLLRVTAEFSPDLAGYDPAQDADLYEYFLYESCGRTQSNPCKIWIEQCEAARGIEDEFGTQKALAYLVGEKFINFLEAAEGDREFRGEIPAFITEIKILFEPWQLAEFLKTARQTERFDPADYDDEEEAEIERQLELRKSAMELLMVERAREWLLEELGSVTSRAPRASPPASLL